MGEKGGGGVGGGNGVVASIEKHRVLIENTLKSMYFNGKGGRQ